VREQAIFALSQLPDGRGTRALIATAEDRSLTREQRKRAVFWLAQSESDEAQAYLQKVLAGNVTK
jgi:HEAT repeat protein